MFSTAKLLEEIKKSNSSNFKIHLLRKQDRGYLREILYYALNPYITYGIANIDLCTGGYFSQKVYWPEVKKILDLCREREITGDFARDNLQAVAAGLSTIEKKLLENILKKDLRCGLGAPTINKAFHKLIPQFKLMKASPMKMSKKHITFPCIVEPKYDGVRVFAKVKDKEVTYYSRNGKTFKNFECFTPLLSQIDDGYYDGEVIGVDFDTLMTETHRKYNKTELPKYFMVFDYVPISYFNKGRRSLFLQFTRKKLLKEAFVPINPNKLINLVEFITVYNEDELQDYYKECLDNNFEGIIIKNMKGLYEYKRSKYWVKLKPEETMDVVILRLLQGTGKYAKTLGSFLVDVDGVNVQVGSGLSDTQREMFWDNREELIGEKIEIKYQEVTKEGSLRFPIFIRLRGDK